MDACLEYCDAAYELITKIEGWALTGNISVNVEIDTVYPKEGETLPRTFNILDVIVCGGNKRLVNGLSFEDTLPCRTVTHVYPTYLCFNT